MTSLLHRESVASLVAGAWAVIGLVGIAAEPGRVPLGVGIAQPSGLAVTANGQTVVSIDAARQAVMAMEPERGDSWRDVVGPATAEVPVPIAAGCLTGDVVAAVCRSGDAWTLRTYRTAPSAVGDPASPLQEIDLGSTKGTGDHVSVAVNRARGWLVVTGLPRPLPPVLRAAVAGLRLGPISDRACPLIPDGYRPVAVTGSPSGDLVLVLRPTDGDDAIGFYDASGRELLRLASGMRQIAGIDFGRSDGMLWAVGSDADGHEGLWRLDAMLRDGRQEVKPTLVKPLVAPAALVAASERVIVVLHGEPSRTVSRIDPSVLDPTPSRSAAP